VNIVLGNEESLSKCPLVKTRLSTMIDTRNTSQNLTGYFKTQDTHGRKGLLRVLKQSLSLISLLIQHKIELTVGVTPNI
jgi:hypothetical protein